MQIKNMVLILDGNSEISAHIRRNLCYLICLMHVITVNSHKPGIFNSKLPDFPLLIMVLILNGNSEYVAHT